MKAPPETITSTTYTTGHVSDRRGPRSSFCFGPAASDQRGLLEDPAAARAARLREAIRQARAAAGADAALRVLEVDPGSRFPERRAVLTPFEA